MPQFGASLTDNARSIIYNRNMFIIPFSTQTSHEMIKKLAFKTSDGV
jgi:hypothetical protein